MPPILLRTAPLLLLGALVAAGCKEEIQTTGAFISPSAAAVVQPEVGGPFREPIGYVASKVGGRIGILDLKAGRFLETNSGVSYMRGAPLATGLDRTITGLATYAPDDSTVTVYAADTRYAQLLEVPHVVGVDDDGTPIISQATFTEPIFAGSGSPTLNDLLVKQGFTTTEHWSICYQSSSDLWWIDGSRSGPMENPAHFGEDYVGTDHTIAFRLEGTAVDGDCFSFNTDNGIVEHDVGGEPYALAMAEDQSLLALIQHDTERDRPFVRWFDPATGLLTEGPTGTDVDLPITSLPARLDWSEDGQTLLVADSGYPAVWAIQKGEHTATEIPLPWPVADVAHLADSATSRLYVNPVGTTEVWMIDYLTGQVIDLNPIAVGDQGMDLGSPVRGLVALRHEYAFPRFTDDGVQTRGRSVAISLHAGLVLYMDEKTGCLVQDELGPRTTTSTTYGSLFDYLRSPSSVTYGPFLERNIANDHHVHVHSCAGIARTEFWELRFDRNLQGWRVKGGLSGLQEGIAYEDLRYTSDNGEVSFVIRAGATPSDDGWRMEFRSSRGVLQSNGDNNEDGEISADEPRLNMPADPVYFHYTVGAYTGTWKTVDRRPYLLLANEGRNSAMRVQPQRGHLEVVWR